MPDFPLGSDATGDKERLLGITPMDDALSAYLAAADEVAPLKASHGTNGTFEHDRKALLAALRIGLRRSALSDPRLRAIGRLTDSAVDDLAHGHPDYAQFLGRSKAEKTRMVELDAAMTAVGMLTNRHNLLLRLDVADRTNMPRSSGIE